MDTYEKAYKNLVAKVKNAHLYAQTDSTKNVLEDILPELRESEDERMMREFNDWLCEEIECRTNDLRDEKDRRTLNMLCYVLTNVKDWLEKRKEPTTEELYAEAGTTEKEYIANTMKMVRAMREKKQDQKPNIELIQRSWYMEGYNERDFGKESKWIIKTGDDGPEYEENPKYGQMLEAEQNPTWSEEDEEMLNEGIELLSYETSDTGIRFRDWLKSHRLQLKPKWCEEDEKNLNKLLQWRHIPYELRQWVAKISEKVNSRPNWKPSEEQMKVLEFAFRMYGDETYRNTINSLYNELKKL